MPSLKNAARVSWVYQLIAVICLVFSSATVWSFNGTVFNLSIVDSQTGEPYDSVRAAMLQELEDLGYHQGVNLHIDYRSMSHYEVTAQTIWQNVIQKGHYHAVFLNGTVATATFKKFAWKDADNVFVFATVTDPVGLGVITDFGRAPPANFTGVSYPVPVAERLAFVRQLFPSVKNIGVIYADMPQSRSYVQWLQAFKDSAGAWEGLKFHFRKVPFVISDEGHRRMAALAVQFIQELDPVVDLFISPNDQMGAQRPFAEVVSKYATSPLIGLGRKDVAENWGAVASMYPSLDQMGKQAAHMLVRIFKGEAVQDIFPETPKQFGRIIDQKKLSQFGGKLDPDLHAVAEIIE